MDYAKQALEIAPNNAGAILVIANLQNYANELLIDSYDRVEIHNNLKKGILLDPYNAEAYLFLSFLYEGTGFLKEALKSLINFYSKGFVIDDGYTLGLQARLQNPLEFIRNSRSKCLLPGWNRHYELYEAYRNLDKDHSELIADIKKFMPDGFGLSSCLREVMLALGDFNYIPAVSQLWEPSLYAYRQSSQFKDFMRKSGAYDYWQEKGFPPQCRPLGDDDFECD